MPELHFSGKYKLIKLLSHSPYAKVYHASDTRSSKSVAIKVIDDVTNLDNLVELHALTRLDHRHVIRLIELATSADTNRSFIVTEFAESGDLFDKIAGSKTRRLSEDLSRQFFHQLISAVKYCHSRGVYHRDIKPENLLLDHKWRLKLSDFGLSAVVGDGHRLYDACGTPEYAAPEVLEGKGYEGGKVDVWSCGVVLYVMCSGFLPFEGDVMEMWLKMKRREFRIPKWISPGLKSLLTRILDPNPDSRITIDEILEDGWLKNGFNLFNHMDELDGEIFEV